MNKNPTQTANRSHNSTILSGSKEARNDLLNRSLILIEDPGEGDLAEFAKKPLGESSAKKAQGKVIDGSSLVGSSGNEEAAKQVK